MKLEMYWANYVKKHGERESIICENDSGLRGDLFVRGIWQTQRDCLISVSYTLMLFLMSPVLSLLTSVLEEDIPQHANSSRSMLQFISQNNHTRNFS